MMAEAGFIPKTPSLAKSQDYAFLRSEGLQYIEKLAHQVWTDYNIHDPGITLLELLCYAITDLGYRAGYDMRDLLSSRNGAAGAQAGTGQFHRARAVLTSAPVTFDDLRKLLIDSVPGVRNIWIEKHTSVKYHLDPKDGKLKAKPEARIRRRTLPLNGLYDVLIEYEDGDDVDRGTVRSEVCKQVLANRSLCQDVVHICDLENEDIAVCARIAVRPSADLEALLADVFYRVENFISPAVRFYTLAELLARHKPIEKIFEGPALKHGFIDDEEFQRIQRRCELRVSDLVDLLMDNELPDLLAIREISLLSFIGNKLRLQEDWILPLAADKARVPRFNPELSKITFYKNDLPYFANKARVMDLLEKKRAAEGRYRLKERDSDLPVPIGEERAVGDYYPVQNDLPAVYGVGQVGIPESAPPLRKAQAKQLKAYLLFFEQLLANYVAQLAHVPQLLSWAEPADGREHTYFSQLIEGIAGTAEIYDPANDDELQKKLDAIAETPRAAQERRSRILDHLLARFCEDFTEYSLLMYSLYGDGQASTRTIKDKRAFLKDYPALSGGRFRAYDYRAPDDAGNISGLQQRVYRMLGIEHEPPGKLASPQLEIVDAGGQWQFVIYPDPRGAPLFESVLCDKRSAAEVLLDTALRLGGSEDNYREQAGRHELVSRCPGQEPSVIGTAASAEARGTAIELFRRFADSEGFHLLEHILLRMRTPRDATLPVQFAGAADGGCCPEVLDPYSFRASVVLPSWPRRFRDLRFRRFAEDTLRCEAPAHVYLRICWVSHDQMKQFEQHYERWAQQLARVKDLLGQCPGPGQQDFSGAFPLPRLVDKEYSDAVEDLIKTLHSLVTVYPLARLHDAEQAGGGEPPVTLNNTNLGTF